MCEPHGFQISLLSFSFVESHSKFQALSLWTTPPLKSQSPVLLSDYVTSFYFSHSTASNFPSLNLPVIFPVCHSQISAYSSLFFPVSLFSANLNPLLYSPVYQPYLSDKIPILALSECSFYFYPTILFGKTITKS